MIDPAQSRLVLGLMQDRAKERREKWQTEIVDVLPDRDEIAQPHIEGDISKVVLPHGIAPGRRYLLSSALVSLGDGIRESPTTAARDYLSVLGYRAIGPRYGAKQALEGVMKSQPAQPIYSQVKQSDDGYYIDIQRCFLSIMCMAGWDVNYYPGRHVVKGRPPLDFPLMDSVIARNSLVSLAANHVVYKVIPPDWIHVAMSSYNKLYNLHLNSLVRDALHAIAWLAKQEGAIYIQTDGYIAPNYRTARNIGQIIRDFGFSYRVKAKGFTAVRGTGAYRVGKVKSKLYQDREQNASGLVAIRDVSYRNWLQREMSNLAATDGALHLISDIL